MFTVKATYHGETRRITFPLTFPTFDQLCEQLRRIFPLKDAFTITRLLFSPNPTKSIRLLIGQRVHSTEDYIRYTEPYRNRIWQDATLRLTVVDGDGESLDVAEGIPRFTFDPQSTYSSYSDMSSNKADNQPSFSGQSSIPMSYIPPPPILFPSYSVPSTPNAHPTCSNNASSAPNPANCSPCCSVEAGKKEIQGLIDNFMRDLDGIMASNFSVQDQPVSSNQSQQDCEQDSGYLRSCMRCKKRAKGLLYYCSQCGVDVCLGCYCAVGRFKCPATMFSYHRLMRHPRVPASPFKPSRSFPHLTIASTPPLSPRNATRRFGMSTGHSPAATATPTGAKPSEAPSPSSRSNNNLNMDEGVSRVVHHAVCDLCDSGIRGHRYKCVVCPDFDTCADCFRITDEQHPNHSFIKLSNPADYIYRWSGRPYHHAMCNVCNATIIGVRYKCLHPDCLDFDLCERCEAHPIPLHPENHPLLKMRTENTKVPRIQRNPAPQTEPSFNVPVEITRDISPNDASSVHCTETPAAKTEVLHQATDIQLKESAYFSPEHQVVEVPSLTPLSANETPSNDEVPEIPGLKSEVEKMLAESPLTNSPLLIRPPGHVVPARESTGYDLSVQAFLGRVTEEEQLNAVIVKDGTVPSGQAFPPGAEFIKTWRVMNSGSTEWPQSTELVFTGGDAMTTDARPILVGNVKVGAEVELSTPGLKAPELIGSYTGCWKLQTQEHGLFGDNLWIDIIVTEPQGETESLSSSSIMKMPGSVLHDGNQTTSDGRTSRVATDETISLGTAETLDNVSYDSDWQDCPGEPEGQEEYVILYDDSSSEEN